jgi:hypothetical protein
MAYSYNKGPIIELSQIGGFTNRTPGKSAYKEAINVCRSLGKNVCIKPQMDSAQSDGFGEISGGWTETGPNRHSLYTVQPISVDVWESDDENTIKQRKVQPISNGIYCCEFQSFEYLDEDYKGAKSWIVNLEGEFQKRYHLAIPVDAKFIVYSQTSKLGLSVQKVDDSSYSPISHPNGDVPTGWPDKSAQVFCQIIGKPSNSVLATFLTTHGELGIKAGDNWDGNSKSNIVQYGSKIKFYNARSKKYLATNKTPYSHIPDQNMAQVVAREHSSSDIWTVEPVHTERTGVITSGDVLYLFNPHTNGRLAANITMDTVPGSALTDVLVTTYSNNNDLSDCQWRVQPVSGSYWYSDSSVRLQHVKTGKVLQIVNGTKAESNTVTIVLGSYYDHRSEWSTEVVKHGAGISKLQQCSMYLNQIARARQLAQNNGPDRDIAMASAHKLLGQFNRECHEISNQAYNKTMLKLYADIRKQLDLLMKETGLYNNYHRHEVTLHNNMKQHDAVIKKQQAKLKAQSVKKRV